MLKSLNSCSLQSFLLSFRCSKPAENESFRIHFIFVLADFRHGSAQTALDLKTDSVQAKTFDKPLKLPQPFTKELPRLVLPENKRLPQNPDLALKRYQEPQLSDNRNTRMPVFRPGYQSNMPVMKPDSSVHYHLRIKRF